MLLGIALIIIVGFSLAEVFKKINLPGFLGMIVTGLVLGPYSLNLISVEIISVSSDLREIALIVILIRAGLNLNNKDILSIGRPALLMSFIPALFEIAAVTVLAPLLFHIEMVDALLLGCILAAVSPAVIVPRMIQLLSKGYGKTKVPQLVMASSSVDDVFVIVLFTSILASYKTHSFDLVSILFIPISIVLGIIFGTVVGCVTAKLLNRCNLHKIVVALILLSFGFLFVLLEDSMGTHLHISGLIATMALGVSFAKCSTSMNTQKEVFSSIWVFAELILFVLVGASVNLEVMFTVGLIAVLMLLIQLLFRMAGVFVSLVGSTFKKKEKIFISISFIPKATVQAAIGSIPLSLGLEYGGLILSVAVMSIFFTAPLGAILIDKFYTRLLRR